MNISETLRAVFLVLAFLGASLCASGRASPALSDDPGGAAIANLQRYLAIDTTNPPGNEKASALFLREILSSNGIESELLDLGNGRANLVARLPGSGRERPVILLHHMDVVPADPKFWTVPPFSAKITSGFLYGRGAVDIKAKGMIDLMAMVQVKRKGVPLSRDIIYLAVADEEDHSSGAAFMVKRRPDLLRNAEFLIDEGRCIMADEKGKPQACLVSIAEKFPVWLTLTFKGPAGHGSVPLPDSSVHRLLRAANRIIARRPPLAVRPELRGYIISRLAGTDPDLGNRIRKSGPEAWNDPLVLRRLARDPNIAAALHDTISLTKLKGSDKVNSIPNEASLGLDCRLFPGTDPAGFIEDLRRIVNDPSMELTIDEMPQNASSTFSPADSAFMRSLETAIRKRHPGLPVVPTILLSSTDSIFFRSLGISCYGFEPYILPESEYNRAHGNDERITPENVRYGLSLMTDLLIDLCADSKPSRN